MYCAGCEKDILPRLTSGYEVYPHREDIWQLRFWKCDTCKNFVGTHKNSKNYAPLGIIPSNELKKARQYIHRLIDPYWRSKKIKRTELYKLISDKVGWNYHTAKIRTVEEARDCWKAAVSILRDLKSKTD